MCVKWIRPLSFALKGPRAFGKANISSVPGFYPSFAVIHISSSI